ncbi:hypothetical protein [Flavobacterium gyeonganense]|uniref:Uncharacterized protein n=1 Tax=Flavobacterium gyeonganense TaxID=1310418 RepID=A0ABV5H5A5_9FLAO|nr:hypothetical protein [Flavobacterium gyeonganense]
MKKHFYYAIALLLLLTVSCVSEKIETQETNASYIPEKVWVYDGNNTVLKGVIQELKNSEKREQLERRLLKNEVLWKNAEFLIIENKKRILVPFLSIDKENIIGFFALYRDSKGKIQYDMTVRSDVFNKNVKLPFWDSNIWVGYFKAYDRTILGKKNGNPGVMRKAVSQEQLKAMTSRLVCYYSPYESCVTVGGGGGDCDGGTGEGWSDCGGGGDSYTVCTTYYNYECFDVPDNPDPNPDPEPEPENPEPEDPGTGGGEIAETPPSCESFNFIQVGSLWQVAMVKNINFKVLGISPNGIQILHVISYPQAVYFGTPTNVQMGNTNITPGIAANVSARVLQKSMQEVVDKYGGTNVSDLILDLYFKERLVHNYPLSVPGGRVKFNPTENIPATDYKTNTWTAGNCN